jgi:hypothetical protein
MVGAASSSVIVATPVASAIVALTGALNWTLKLSSSSSMVSWPIATVIVCDSTPGAKFRLPDSAVKSAPLVALPPMVAKSTETGRPEAALSVTVKVTVPAASLTLTSSMLSAGAASSSTIVPVPVTPPTVSGRVSSASSVLSGVVGTLTLKVVTPAGTVMLPSGLSVTPSLKTGVPMSPAAAVPPPSVNG